MQRMSIIALKRVVNKHNFLLTVFLQDYISFPVALKKHILSSRTEKRVHYIWFVRLHKIANKTYLTVFKTEREMTPLLKV